MVKLSIIVPIYGVEQYLRKCVDSLLAQDYDDYEIILVDDGSPDGCPAICDEYASLNSLTHSRFNSLPKICVIHQPNGGLSAARNSGIEVAKGEYVCFVDSDDYWQQNVLSGLMEQIVRDDLDVLRFNFQNVRIQENDGQYEVFEPNKAPKRDVDYSDSVTDGETFLNERLGPMCYASLFILKRELLSNCIFKNGVYFEDVEWTPHMLLKARRVASTNRIVYNYLWREGSITLPTDPAKRKKVIEDKIALISGFMVQSQQVKNPEWFIRMTSYNTMSILNMIIELPSEEQKTYINKLKSLQIFPLYTKGESILSHKIKTILANISLSLYCKLMKVVNTIR